MKNILKVQYVIWTASVWNAVVHIQNIGSPAPFSSMLMGCQIEDAQQERAQLTIKGDAF